MMPSRPLAATSILRTCETPRGGSTLTIWPHRPKAITDALDRLAETPGLTLEQYEAEKTRILTRDRP